MHGYVDANWFGSQVEQMIPNADVMIVFGGTNDFDIEMTQSVP